MSQLYEWLVEFDDNNGRRISATVVSDSYIKAVSKARDKLQAGGAMVSLLERMGTTWAKGTPSRGLTTTANNSAIVDVVADWNAVDGPKA